MGMSKKLRRAPGRIASGAYILNSGIAKLSGDEATAKGVHGLAAGAYPVLDRIGPKTFLKAVAISEVGLGGALLAPVVGPKVAAAGLLGFSGSLLGMYWRTPAMHKPGDPRPTQAGIAISKDVWMFAIGAGLLIDGVLSPDGHRKHKKAARKAKKARAKKV
ncbi:MAG: hypothetical protein JWN95_2255 [Frankiales bacterium]|nr:hypothetical protein [Frankiales bacterium]